MDLRHKYEALTSKWTEIWSHMSPNHDVHKFKQWQLITAKAIIKLSLMYIGKNGLPLPQLVEKVWALSFNWWTTWVDKASSKGEISSFLKDKKRKKQLVCLQLDCTNQITLTPFGVQGWRSGESTRLPPLWPGFDSQIRRQMWVEFVGSLLCTERFSPGTPVSPHLKNQNLTWLC